MALVLISGPAASGPEPGQKDLSGLVQASCDANITCLFSFVSADQSTMYYVCEVDSVEALQDLARDSDRLASVVMEVSEILPGNLDNDTLLDLFSDILYRFR